MAVWMPTSTVVSLRWARVPTWTSSWTSAVIWRMWDGRSTPSGASGGRPNWAPRWPASTSATPWRPCPANRRTDAWLNLGSVLQTLGDLAGAMRAFREAFQAGDVEGALALAFCLREQAEPEQAMTAARDAAAAGSLAAAGVLACWEWDESLDPALEPALRAGAAYYPSARADLAELLCSTGRVTEACEVLEQGAKLGEQESWLPLGNLYADEFGDFTAARDAYLGGIAAGDTHCHHNLGVLLVAQGLTDDAEEQFRLGAEAGDALASRALRDLRDGD
jgi:tetratricopeptide (TPR) repeat protein